jgi:hypothetical protein
MSLTTYGYSNAVSAFFEMPTDMAKDCLPRHLQPLEVRHGSGVFAVTAFDFTESMVGAYKEIVLAVIVPPLLKPEGEFPKSAFYPFLLGTSTPQSRSHAIERWHLPHFMADVDVDFDETPGRIQILVHENDKPILEMSVHDYQWNEVDHLYQCFMKDGGEQYKVDIHMRGQQSEHEDEKCRLTLHDHPMVDKLDPAEVEEIAFRELWMKNGMQVFEELEIL